MAFRNLMWMIRAMSSGPTKYSHQTPRGYLDTEKIVSASISSVSPPNLVAKAISFDKESNIIRVRGQEYKINNNVKVVGFGKAVLGMVAALEGILGDHITEGVASVPVGALEISRKFYPHHVPQLNSRIKIYEGAAGNLPDSASEAAAKEVLSVATKCTEKDLLVVLISGGGSALLSYPVEGVTIEEKRRVIENLSKGGASIQEINTVRKAISQTKGGKLAEAAFPAQVIALVLSDVVGDPLDIIASGPTFPHKVEMRTVLDIMEKFGFEDGKVPSSVKAYLKSDYLHSGDTVVPSSGLSQNAHNVIIGSNDVATTSAQTAAMDLGYTCYVWSRLIQGEARILGEIYAMITLYISMKQKRPPKLAELEPLLSMLHSYLNKISRDHPELETDIFNLIKKIEGDVKRPFCLIGAGEPTVKVTGRGRGGRNQELALAYVIKLDEMSSAHCGPERISEVNYSDCVFTSIGTDGQDGPCDAAGATVDHMTAATARKQGLDPLRSLSENDSYSFFSELNSGRNLIKTGLTGTNVMDIHILLIN